MLKINFAAAPDKKIQTTGFLVTSALSLGKNGKSLDKSLRGTISQALTRAPHFKGKEGQLLSFFTQDGARIVLLGIGKGDEPERAGAKIAAALDKEGLGRLALHIEKTGHEKIAPAELAARFAQGLQLRLYRFGAYKTKKNDEDKNGTLDAVTFVLADAAKAKTLFSPLELINESVFFARDLACEPANVLYPESFAQRVLGLKKLGVKVEVLDEQQMEKLGMGAFLCVGKGSARPPRLVVMTWAGAGSKNQKPIALVGKGVTFDSGGISLKPGAGMWDMKYDMCGAAAVVGAIKALASRKAKVHVVGLVGLVENMPSGTATRPGDIVTSASGQTIDVQNTDAEGRLVLADVLWYAQKQFKPRCLIDIATLTGAMRTSLGQEYAGLFSNDDKLASALTRAGDKAREKLWRMPMAEGYDKKLDSPIADMKNIGGPEAGSCTAAHFLKRFVKDGMPWAHLDIASVAYDNKAYAFAPDTGPAGFGVRLMSLFIDELARK